MTSIPLAAECLAGAGNLADRLLAKAVEEPEGCYWECPAPSGVKAASDNLYSGTAGIALFLMELWHRTDYHPYYRAVERAFDWVENYCRRQEGEAYPGYYTGRLGVCVAMARFAQLSQRGEWLEKALFLAESVCSLETEYDSNDLINGRAGTILGLLHLHQRSQASWLLNKIDHLLGELLNEACFDEFGLYWDRDPHQIGGLCGFSHGASGLAFLFLELDYYFQNRNFITLARLAIDYENNRFQEARQCWPDLRKGFYSKHEHALFLQKFQEGDFDFFIQPAKMDAWCHGAPGIALSRLRAYRSVHHSDYFDDFEKALTISKPLFGKIGPEIDYTPCHGASGNWEFIIEAVILLDRPELWQLIHPQVCFVLDMIDTGKTFKSGHHLAEEVEEDFSLFQGSAGIGYQLLRISNPMITPSILSPQLSSKCRPVISKSDYPVIRINGKELRNSLVGIYYGRTLKLLDESGQDEGSILYDVCQSAANPQSFSYQVEKAMRNSDMSTLSKINDAFTYESKIYEMDSKIKSLTLVYFEQESNMARLRKHRDHIDTCIIEQNPNVFIIETQYNWLSEGSHMAPERTFVLLNPGVKGVEEIPISPFAKLILTTFKEPGCLHDVTQSILRSFGDLSQKQQNHIRRLVREQVMGALEVGILMLCGAEPEGVSTPDV
ncbi:MAG: lanthionine synthetase LanC family protein [Acidobacteriota bacterium]|nr:lanthionine synthetase LanC family protein [Acidobacteriota bacterium]